MRIMAEINSNMEKDLVLAEYLLEEIKTALFDIKRVLDFKKNSAQRIIDLENQIEYCKEKLASIDNTQNVQRLYKYRLKDELAGLATFDLQNKKKIAKKLLVIKESRRDLKDMRARTEEELAECKRLLERRKSIRVHENLFGFTLSLVNTLSTKINEYRTFRKDFYDYHGLMLPAINLSDCIKRTNGKEIELTDFELPKLEFMPFIDEEVTSLLESSEEDNIEVYDF